MKKRIYALLLALMMALMTVLSACGGEETTTTTSGEEETTIEESTEPIDYSVYEYGDIDYSQDVTGIDMTLVEKTVGEIDRETLEYAIQQVCLAYYYKGADTQYECWRMCYDDYDDSYYRTTGQSPEDTEWDSCWYSQCAEYTYDVYYELCGYEFLYVSTLRSTSPSTTLNMGVIPASNANYNANDQEAIANYFLYEARPGDIYYGNGESGHVIMIVGDLDGDGENDCLHCWPYEGGSMNLNEGSESEGTLGAQKWDTYGIVMQSVRELITNTQKTGSEPYWGVFNEKYTSNWWRIYRPFEQSDIKECHLSTDTVTRITYEGIEVSKVPEDTIYYSVLQGDDIVITETITNHGKEDYKGLNITEYVPDGTTYVTSDGGTLNGRKIQWTVDVPAGKSVSFTYTVKAMYGAGMEINVPAGLVAGLQTRKFTLQVGKSEFTEEQLSTMATMAKTKKFPDGVDLSNATEIDFVTEFYKQVLGKEISLPSTVNELLAAYVEEQHGIQGCERKNMLFRKTDLTGYESLNKLMIRNMIGGYYFSTGEYPGVENFTVQRAMNLRAEYLMPGDVFIAFSGDSTTSLASTDDLKIYIYLGNNKVAAVVNGRVGIMGYAGSIDLLLGQNFFIGIRPNLYQ